MNLGNISMDKLRRLARESGISEQELETRLEVLHMSHLVFCAA